MADNSDQKLEYGDNVRVILPKHVDVFRYNPGISLDWRGIVIKPKLSYGPIPTTIGPGGPSIDISFMTEMCLVYSIDDDCVVQVDKSYIHKNVSDLLTDGLRDSAPIDALAVLNRTYQFSIGSKVRSIFDWSSCMLVSEIVNTPDGNHPFYRVRACNNDPNPYSGGWYREQDLMLYVDDVFPAIGENDTPVYPYTTTWTSSGSNAWVTAGTDNIHTNSMFSTAANKLGGARVIPANQSDLFIAGSWRPDSNI